MAKHAKRLIAVILALVMVLGLAIPAGASTGSTRLEWGYSDITPDPRNPKPIEREENQIEYADDEVVRVSIVLDGDSTLDKGFSTIDIANNKKAVAYRNELQAEQEAIEVKIEKEVLDGEPLDVEWNLTLVANMISANVEYGQIEDIKDVKGVKDVVLELQYAPAVSAEDLPDDPQMSTSSVQIGSGIAWAEGYTGAGSTVAIIDTGIDLDHKSFDADAFDYAIDELIKSGKEVDLMDVSDIEDVMDQLNIVKLGDYTGSASGLYQSSKIPFAFNYVDGNLDVTHDNDGQGEHGSHVTGIAAANRYIKDGSDYVDALSSVLTQGVAPDAQIITMKVFGKGGGAYDSDYMAAIEDAVILGADTVNLSLGSSMAGFSRSDAYESVLDKLVKSDTVVTMSAGNNGYWAENSYLPYLYGDDVNFDTAGSPGSFTNSLGVASVDNVGSTGAYITVGGEMIFYTESSGYRNPEFTTIANDYDFVYLDCIGVLADDDGRITYNQLQLLRNAGVDLNGKIILCNRGTSSFYLKANAAANLGAAAVIIVNNQPGTINMDLTGYTGRVPVVSITQADGELFKTTVGGTVESTYDAYGNAGASELTYYTGTVTVGSDIASTDAEKSEDGTYTMSDFSSWGVPGSLTMKPEITAPGGNIYSVNGLPAGGEAYENMSGTSMASPQVTGMAAVIAQYIRENSDRFADSKLTTRGLINSLLMATAEPIFEADSGNYYSILTQGSGLANIGNAVSADAYIIMDDNATASAADGKVKVELGDDPSRNGIYEYGFTIYNTSDAENVYTLDTDMFTQDLFIEEGYLLLDTWTTPISADVTYVVDGKPFDVDARIDADVNMDGYTDDEDAQAVLDYLVGNIPEEDYKFYDFGAGDLDGCGDLSSYDAHLILKGVEARLAVPANGSAKVDVTIEINEDLSIYEKGAYIEGYTFVKSVASEEGELDNDYSIPILGFYGNWSDPSMFDRLDIEGDLYGSDHDIPYTGMTTDKLDYRDGDDRNTYYLFGNPYALDEEYHPEREALRNKDTLTAYYYSLIRNAGARLAVIYDADGNVAYSTSVSSEYAAFYNETAGAWYYTSSGVSLGVKVADLNTAEDEQFTFEMYAIPEYYLTDEMYEDGAITVDEALSVVDQLGDGAVVSKAITVDNTAPKIIGDPTTNDNGDLMLTVKDNQYIAYAVALSRSGALMYAEITADDIGQTAAGEEVELVFSGDDLAGAGEYVAVAVYDYAGNMNVIEVKYGEHVDRVGKMYGFTSNLFTGYNTWLELTPEEVNITATLDEGYDLEDVTSFAVATSEYIDGYVFQADAAGNLYVAPESDFGLTDLIGNMGVTPVDMAYDYNTHNLYALVQTGTSTRSAMYAVYEIEPLTARATRAFTVEAKNGNTYQSLYGMAIDDDGTFYFDSTNLYVAKDWDGSATSVTPDRLTGSLGNYRGALAWDHNTGKLYMVSKANSVGNNNNYLAVVNTETGSTTRANGTNSGSQLYSQFTTIFVAPGLTAGEDFEATEVVESIEVTPTEATIVKGTSSKLDALVKPWTLSDKGVTWESSDESVAVVDELGYVTGVSNGTATITATTNAKDASGQSLTATCEVEVVSIELEFNGIVWDESGDVWWSEINTAKLPEYEKLNSTAANRNGTYFSSAAVDLIHGVLFGSTWDGETVNDATSDVYIVDPTSFESEYMGYSELPYVDMADTMGMSYHANYNYVVAAYGPYVLLVDALTGEYEYILWQNKLGTNIVGVTWAGLTTYQSHYVDIYYAIDTNGNIFMFGGLYGDLGSGEGLYGLTFGLTNDLLGSTGISTDVPYFNSLYYIEGETDSDASYIIWSRYSATEDDVDMILIDEDTFDVYNVGSFGESVWPVGGLMTLSDASYTLDSVVRTESVASVSKCDTTKEVTRIDLNATSAEPIDDTSEQIAVTGTLDSISTSPSGAVDTSVPNKNFIVDTNANTVTVKIYAKDSTNGLLSVNYDADVLTLASVNGLTDYNAHNSETAGEVKFDYADADALNQQVAKIIFTYDEEDEGTLVTDIIVAVAEDGDDLAVDKEETLKIDLTKTETPDEKPSGSGTSPITGAEIGIGIVLILFATFVLCVVVVLPKKRRKASR